MGPSEYHHGNLRVALLDAAERAVEQSGERDLSLRAIARELGVSHAAPAHHFRSRDDLLTALAIRGFGRLADEMQRSRPGLRAVGETYVDFAVASPGLYRLMFAGDLVATTSDDELLSVAMGCYAILVDCAQAAGVDAMAAWSLVHGYVMLWLEDLIPDERATDGRRLGHEILGCLHLVDG